ncbi:uncharacterized protein LOC125918123 [Panthera uncia]|uniref:uncharacterized protein LOC125918123 n=1 Tax=Panthera uncia TaxID=29064 RepID=UPI0020FF9747|nr:uncharacterized protein LOC125918123 [Panthera uncia]
MPGRGGTTRVVLAAAPASGLPFLPLLMQRFTAFQSPAPQAPLPLRVRPDLSGAPAGLRRPPRPDVGLAGSFGGSRVGGGGEEWATRSTDREARWGPGVPRAGLSTQAGSWRPSGGRGHEGGSSRGVPDLMLPPASLSPGEEAPVLQRADLLPWRFTDTSTCPSCLGHGSRRIAGVLEGSGRPRRALALWRPFTRSACPSLAEPNDESGANVDASKMWRDDREQFCRVARQLAQKSLGL